MPIYEYQCNACSHAFEALQKMSDTVLTNCPACHQPALQKMISASSFQLKGTGWYATDFKTKPKAETKVSNDTSPDQTVTSNPASAVGAETASTPSPETKPVTKTETKTDK